MTTMTEERRDVLGWAAVATAVGVLLAIVLLAVYRIADPLVGDHAVFMEYAIAQDHGAILYVDRWDPKGPFLSWFYLLAGRLAGFTEIGLRVFEIGYQVAFAAAMIVALRGTLRRRWLEILAPIATIGVYYAMTGIRHLTQAEFLVAFPLFLSLWFAARPWDSLRSRRLALFASGVCAGIVVGFKIPFAPIIIVGWILSLWTARDPLTFGSVVRDRILPAAAGGVLVLAGIALWFGVQGALDELLWAMFVFPLVTSGAEAPLGRLARSVAWYALGSVPWLILAATSLVRWRGRRDEWLTIQMIGWLVSGGLVVLAHRYSWWDYHFTLFIVPVGLLAVRGADGLIAAVREGWRPAVSVLLAIVLFATPAAIVLARLAMTDFAQVAILTHLDDRDQVREHQARFSNKYGEITAQIAELEAKGPRPGPIYVFGDPLRTLLWGREQAVPLSPWMWEYVADEQYATLPAELAAAAPVYVYLEEDLREFLTERTPETMAWLAAGYEPFLIGPDGTWYERRS